VNGVADKKYGPEISALAKTHILKSFECSYLTVTVDIIREEKNLNGLKVLMSYQF